MPKPRGYKSRRYIHNSKDAAGAEAAPVTRKRKTTAHCQQERELNFDNRNAMRLDREVYAVPDFSRPYR